VEVALVFYALRKALLIFVSASALFGTALAHAQPPEVRVIPKSYISPGASGSIERSERYQQHDLYNGQRLPDGVRREGSYSGSERIETRGGLRQSIEYPNGQRFEITPGSSAEQRQTR
jgi:hypothetical protein